MMLAGVQATGQSREIAVQGLSAKLDITVDRWGIPHISAGSVNDAFFGQGYAAEMMRLWQLDITHRRQLGRLAEVFGPNFVPYDRAARPNGRMRHHRGTGDETAWRRGADSHVSGSGQIEQAS
jgi:penicillin amidase